MKKALILLFVAVMVLSYSSAEAASYEEVKENTKSGIKYGASVIGESGRTVGLTVKDAALTVGHTVRDAAKSLVGKEDPETIVTTPARGVKDTVVNTKDNVRDIPSKAREASE